MARVEENVVAIRQMMEIMMNQQRMIPSSENHEEIINVKQVAKFLGLNVIFIYSKCSRGEIPHFRIGKQYRFKKSEILKWVKNQKELSQFSVDEYVESYLQKNVLKA